MRLIGRRLRDGPRELFSTQTLIETFLLCKIGEAERTSREWIVSSCAKGDSNEPERRIRDDGETATRVA